MINFVPAKDSFSGRWLARLGKVLGLRSETVYSRAILLTTLAFLVLGGLVVSGVWYAMFRQFDAADVADARQSAAAVREFLGRGEASVPAPSRMSEASGLLGREITFRPDYRALGKSDSGEIAVKKLPGGQVESSFHFGDGEVVISGSRSFYETGTSIARLVLVGLAVAGGVALLFILFIVDRTILSRVQLLIDRVEHEKQSERLPVKLDVPGDDEIAQLAGSIEELARLVQIAEREYRNVVEDQTESICRFDAGGKITFSNKAFEALCVAPPTGKRPLLAACLGSGVRTSLEQALGDLRPDKPIAQFTHAGPGDRWYRSILRANFDADSVRTGAQWIASEVTSEVAAQRKLQESRRQLASLSAKLMSLQDEERRRLARELHDSTAQSLAALEINMGALASMDNPTEAKRLAEESGAISRQVCDELRTISYLLHPPLLEEAGLVFALRWLADGFTKRNNLPVSVEVQPDFPRLSPDLETALFRIVQESLSNIYRHAGATKAWIVLGRDEGGGISLEIRDNGEGLPDDFSLVRSSGVGLAGMRERMRELGGTLEIESSDYGVAVKCRLKRSDVSRA